MARIIAEDSVTNFKVMLDTEAEFGEAISTILNNPLTVDVSVKFKTGNIWTYYKETK